MTTVGAYGQMGGAGLPAPVRRVEKPPPGNALHGEQQDRERSSDERRAVPGDRRVSQIGTASRTPLWNGPRFTAPFVAQVLGQIMPEGTSAAPSALAAYSQRTARPTTALLFDADV